MMQLNPDAQTISNLFIKWPVHRLHFLYETPFSALISEKGDLNLQTKLDKKFVHS